MRLDGANAILLSYLPLTAGQTNLECLFFPRYFKLAQCLWVKPGTYPQRRAQESAKLWPYLQIFDEIKKACQAQTPISGAPL
jgi:hypothetical protein